MPKRRSICFCGQPKWIHRTSIVGVSSMSIATCSKRWVRSWVFMAGNEWWFWFQLLTTMVTYLVVLLQFQISIPEDQDVTLHNATAFALSTKVWSNRSAAKLGHYPYFFLFHLLSDDLIKREREREFRGAFKHVWRVVYDFSKNRCAIRLWGKMTYPFSRNPKIKPHSERLHSIKRRSYGAFATATKRTPSTRSTITILYNFQFISPYKLSGTIAFIIWRSSSIENKRKWRKKNGKNVK